METNNSYPKDISFSSRLNYWTHYDCPQKIKEAIEGTKMVLLAENVLQITYPEELVEQVRTVNVDDTIFRIDLVLKGTQGLDRERLFPDVPWNRKNFFENKRFDHAKRTESPGRVTIEYPVSIEYEPAESPTS